MGAARTQPAAPRQGRTSESASRSRFNVIVVRKHTMFKGGRTGSSIFVVCVRVPSIRVRFRARFRGADARLLPPDGATRIRGPMLLYSDAGPLYIIHIFAKWRAPGSGMKRRGRGIRSI